jgi:hypothetical protein
MRFKTMSALEGVASGSLDGGAPEATVFPQHQEFVEEI